MTLMAEPTRVAPPRPDASMSLLTDLMERSLDDGYADAALRRDSDGAARTGGWVLLVGLLALGLLLSTAAAQARNRASSAEQARTALAADIEERTQVNDRAEAALDRVRDSVAAARRDALRLTSEGSTLAASLTPLEAATGATPVRGPALVVHLEDAPADGGGGADVDPRTESSGDGRVTDRDLQTIVNEVWAAGAEAVAVNDRRLTSLSAIRSAGEAVLVDFLPLSPPYDVVGIGNPATLRANFAEGFGGSYVQALRDYGIDYSLRTRDSVRLNASAGITLRYARAAGPTPTTAPATGESPS